jgi:hypothetical protein
VRFLQCCLEESPQQFDLDLCLRCLRLRFAVDCDSHVRPLYVVIVVIKQGAHWYCQDRCLEQKPSDFWDCYERMVDQRCIPYPRQVCPAADWELKISYKCELIFIRYREGE